VSGKTAYQRIQRYRERQTEIGLIRHELRIAPEDRDAINALAKKRRKQRQSIINNKYLDFVLGTLNAPRPHPISGRDLLDCLRCDVPIACFKAHIEALFTEISAEALYWLVLSGVTSFEELNRAQIVWKHKKGPHYEWLQEMAELELARNAQQNLTHSE